jgi:hypothetical protein
MIWLNNYLGWFLAIYGGAMTSLAIIGFVNDVPFQEWFFDREVILTCASISILLGMLLSSPFTKQERYQRERIRKAEAVERSLGVTHNELHEFLRVFASLRFEDMSAETFNTYVRFEDFIKRQIQETSR